MVESKKAQKLAQRKRLQSLLRQIRLEAGLRQLDLANRLGEPQSFVSKYESGERRLDIVELQRICQVVGMTLAEFVRRFEEPLLEGQDDETR